MTSPVLADSSPAHLLAPRIKIAALSAALATLAACATPAPVPPPPPPPPPVVQLIPPRPAPPPGSFAMMTIPPAGLDGQRLSVNSSLTPAQTTWNMRSALNVAALNCNAARHAPILANYSSFLDRLERPLRTTSNTVLSEFRDRYGRRQGQAEYDRYMTKVYNYFALPQAKVQFCDTALSVSTDALIVDSTTLEGFSFNALARLEAVFQNFYASYESYQRNLANWNATYGPNAVPGTPVPANVRAGSLAPTPGEQVIFRESPQGTALAPGATTTAAPAPVIVATQAEPTPSGELAPSQVVPVGDPAPAQMPSIDPGASIAEEAAPAAPVSSGGIVFTSEPVVQPVDEDGDE